jgi:hypothetical protein
MVHWADDGVLSSAVPPALHKCHSVTAASETIEARISRHSLWLKTDASRRKTGVGPRGG